MAKKKKKTNGTKPRRKRWDVSCEATVRVCRDFRVLALTEEDAKNICMNRTGRDFDSGVIWPSGEFEIETQSESDWKVQ